MSGEKKIKASAKRLNELRMKGNVPKSTDLTTTVVLGVLLFGMLYFGTYFAGEMARYMTRCFTEIGKAPFDMTVQGSVTAALTSPLTMAMIILCGVLILGVVLSHVAQTGFIFSPGRIGQTGFGALNPAEGVKRLFSPQRLVHTLNSLIKLVLIVVFTNSAIQEMLHYNVFIGPVSPRELGAFYAAAAWAVGWRVLLALALISTIDLIYQRWQYGQDNRMSFQEVRDEHRQTEGSTDVKMKMRGMARKMGSLRRMLEDVSDATIVITNPTHYAVALRYVRDVTPAPIVLAKGMNRNARKIREKAESLGVALQENRSLAQGLYKHGQLGKPIPAIYFQAVAQILAELFRRGYRRT
jgi:flagellar biosynthetic protein FlhB